MIELAENFKNRRVVFLGENEIQCDLTGIYQISDFSCIDTASEKFSIRSLAGQFDAIKEHHEYLIICIEMQNDLKEELEKAQFQEFTDYCIAEYLLICHDLVKSLINKHILFYGNGNTFEYFKDELEQFITIPEKFLASSNPEESEEIIDINSYQPEKDTFIVVSSIYYQDIRRELSKKHLEIGKDYLHIYTFVKLLKYDRNLTQKYLFEDRRKSSDKLLVILSGYKEFVWENVFSRIEKFLPMDIDVCVVTSGLESKAMRQLCTKNDWSYISTADNNVSLAINIAIFLHPAAKMIYKLDEDIFITKGIFETMLATYQYVQKNTFFETAFVTPLIPVNGFGYVDVLQRFGLTDKWEKKFGKQSLKYTDCYRHHRLIHDNPEAAEFMWGADDDSCALSDIDKMEEVLQKDDMEFQICPIRFSIGFILFSRDNWIGMDMFPVDFHQNMGTDEIHICKYALMSGRAIVESLNTVAGHLSYGPQHKHMEQFYYRHIDRFALKGTGD